MRTDGSDQFRDTSSPLSCPDTNNKADQHPQASNPGILAWSDGKELRQHLRPPGRCNAPLGGSLVQLYYLFSSLFSQLQGRGLFRLCVFRYMRLSRVPRLKGDTPSVGKQNHLQGEKNSLRIIKGSFISKSYKNHLWGLYAIVGKNLSWSVSFLWLPKSTHIFPSTLVANLL